MHFSQPGARILPRIPHSAGTAAAAISISRSWQCRRRRRRRFARRRDRYPDDGHPRTQVNVRSRVPALPQDQAQGVASGCYSVRHVPRVVLHVLLELGEGPEQVLGCSLAVHESLIVPEPRDVQPSAHWQSGYLYFRSEQSVVARRVTSAEPRRVRLFLGARRIQKCSGESGCARFGPLLEVILPAH